MSQTPLTESEFRGYVVRALQDIDKDLDHIEQRCSTCAKRFQDLEGFRLTIKIYLAIASVVGSIVGSVITYIVTRLIFSHLTGGVP